MNTMSTIYDEMNVLQDRVPVTPEAITAIISRHVTVLGYTVGENCAIKFAVEPENGIKPAINELKNTRFKKSVRIKTDGKTTIIVELVSFG